MKILAKNRRANYDYAISEKMVAGVALTGAEVKSIKAGHVSLKGAYVNILTGEAYLIGAHVIPYQNAPDFESERSRKLLLHRRQINQLMERRQAGLSAVPLAILEQKGLIKVEIGIGRGKKRFDKRESIKRREQEREAARKAKT